MQTVFSLMSKWREFPGKLSGMYIKWGSARMSIPKMSIPIMSTVPKCLFPFCLLCQDVYFFGKNELKMKN